jgi:hypothetical protein
MKATIRALAGLAVLLFSASSAMADSATCVLSGCSAGPLSVTFSVTIPGFVRFELGAAGTNPDVQFNTGVTSANIGNATPVSADTVTNGGAGANGTDQVRYAVLSNLGGTDVTIAAAAGVPAGGLTSGGNTIPYTEIGATTTASVGAAVAMPAAGGSTSITPTGGIINRVGFWNYTFGNSAVYPAGTYTGSIVYTATHTP